MLGACLWSILLSSEVSYPELGIQAWVSPGSSQVMTPLLPLGCSSTLPVCQLRASSSEKQG